MRKGAVRKEYLLQAILNNLKIWIILCTSCKSNENEIKILYMEDTRIKACRIRKLKEKKNIEKSEENKEANSFWQGREL